MRTFLLRIFNKVKGAYFIHVILKLNKLFPHFPIDLPVILPAPALASFE